MLALASAFENHDVFIVTNRSPRKPRAFRRAYYIRGFGSNLVASATSGIWILAILVRERPSIAISTGAQIAVPFLILSRLFGAKTIYIESPSRTRSLSVSGKFLLGRVSHFVVQSPDLCRKYEGKAEFWGHLL
jgi:UDP-N-acetylglucosamine:LPS N-acetylglucosamine transferase